MRAGGRINYIYNLCFISDKLREVFDRNPSLVFPYRVVRDFIRSIRVWNRDFPRPPRELLVRWDLEGLKAFYASKLDLSIFDPFPPADRELIIDEVLSYVVREVMDTYVGARLRNLAETGVALKLWERYKRMVRRYYEEVVPPEKKRRLEKFREHLVRQGREDVERVMDKAMGELFCEVDMLRRMSPMALEEHLRWVGMRPRPGGVWAAAHLPADVELGFRVLGLRPTSDVEAVKARYRELARLYHPDKGGDPESMRRLNEAYRRVMRFLTEARPPS